MSDVTWSSASVGFWPQYLRTALSWLVLMLPSPLQSCWMKASWNFPICSELRWEFSIFLLWGTSLTPHTTVKDLPYTSLNRSIPTGSDSIGLYVAFYYSSRTLSKHSPLITVYNSVLNIEKFLTRILYRSMRKVNISISPWNSGWQDWSSRPSSSWLRLSSTKGKLSNRGRSDGNTGGAESRPGYSTVRRWAKQRGHCRQ